MRSATIFSLAVILGVAGASRYAQGQAVTSNTIRVSWTAPGDDSLSGTASQFDLRYSTSAITGSNFNNATRWAGTPTPAAAGTRQSVTVTGLTPNTTYYFAIKTADEVPNWAGISNILSQATLPAADIVRPGPITTLAVTGTTETTASLRWNAVGDDSLTGTATSYDVRFSTSPITASNWGSASQATGEPAPASPGTVQNFTLSGLARQTAYYFAVRASDEAGNVSALSNVVNATTPDQTPPAAIRDLTVGFIWVGWHGGSRAVLPRVVGPRDRRGS
jgi:phosphodiesterase/alkaline phosphatase D-like protein